MLSVNRISNVNYRVSKSNSEKQSNAPKSAIYASDSVNFAGRGNAVVKLEKDVQKIFGNISFVRDAFSTQVKSVGPMNQNRAHSLLRKYHQAQSADFRRVVESVKSTEQADIDAFYTALLGHVEKYPLEWGAFDSHNGLNYAEINISRGCLLEPEPGVKGVLEDASPILDEYFNSTLPARILINDGLTPESLIRGIPYKGKVYQIKPELVMDGGKNGIALMSRELKAAY